jgi:rubrerythrin
VGGSGIDSGPDDDVVEHRRALVRILQDAHAGELAAAYAYRGHWRSRMGAKRRAERDEIRRIEEAEWHHRRQIAVILDELGEGPRRPREWLMATIGRVFGTLCYVSFRFMPMYAAGRLEAMNVQQYVDAAAHARACGWEAYGTQIDAMVTEERRHEVWFSDQCRGHWALPLVAVVGRWRPLDPTSDPSDASAVRPAAEAPTVP